MGFALGRADTDEALVNTDGDPDSGFMVNGLNATDAQEIFFLSPMHP